MPRHSLLIPPRADFWHEVARALLDSDLRAAAGADARDLSALRVVVPAFAHAQLLKAALAARLPGAFIPPRITTLSAWLALQPPESGMPTPASSSQRLMSLYAELRQHAWLKKLFGARRNTDLLPLAQTLLGLFDELSAALLPSMQAAPDAANSVDLRWEAALAQLATPARTLLSDEAQLVWSLWKSQLDSGDPCALRFAQMMRLAREAHEPLVWIGATAPEAMEEAFLEAYGQRVPLWEIRLDWRAPAIAPLHATAWNEILEEGAPDEAFFAAPGRLALRAASSLEDEAVHGAQIVIDWLREGKSRIAVIAQDRVVARRIRALLERAQVYVCDETGWKLSTTRTASAIAALLDVVATRAETNALLDLLKSPFLFADADGKSDYVMAIEQALRSANVLGGWEMALTALQARPQASAALQLIADQARLFTGRKTLSGWMAATSAALHALGMHDALAADAAGVQVVAMLDALAQDCHGSPEMFSFAEWRAFLSLHMESTPFVPADSDRRVVMLQLNGARLRSFDAVLMVGADADHLPSQLEETLFFANAVRRELGLPTREMRQRQQLRDFAELLAANGELVLSWQTQRNGEPNPPSPWIERLQLALERAGQAPLPMCAVAIDSCSLQPCPVAMPAPAAPQLVPRKLSASGYNSLVACPYQFFATRMLGLDKLDELSDMPEKRDYGDWLHRILSTYHDVVRDEGTALQEREALLRRISDDVFEQELERSAAALAYYMRWQKALPAYLAWANERESQGWRFEFGERRFDKLLSWEGGTVTLHGRIDRVDCNADGERAVLDYKTRPLKDLRSKLREREDHQLAFYGLLSDVPVACAHYVALEPEKDRTGDAEAMDFAQWQQALEASLVSAMQAIAQGAPLRATGINRVCEFCEVRGLCRKGGWW